MKSIKTYIQEALINKNTKLNKEYSDLVFNIKDVIKYSGLIPEKIMIENEENLVNWIKIVLTKYKLLNSKISVFRSINRIGKGMNYDKLSEIVDKNDIYIGSGGYYPFSNIKETFNFKKSKIKLILLDDTVSNDVSIFLSTNIDTLRNRFLYKLFIKLKY